MTVKEITFGQYSQDEFGLLPESVEIEPAQVKTHLISVPGRDAPLDFTESLDGCIHYENRTIIMNMQCFSDDEEYMQMEKKCRNLLHGCKEKIYFDVDPGYYYYGRISVDWKSEANIDRAIITADCDPYKYKTNVTVVEQDIAESGTVTLTNEKKPVIPIITTDAQMQLSFTIDGTEHTASVNSGTHQIPELFLKSGTYPITVTGTGHIKFEYQEGAL